MENLIIGATINKTFGKTGAESQALTDVSLNIAKGEFVAIMGPSGCGKSSLLYALSGMDTVTSGSVIFDSIDLSQLSENALADIRRTKMGFIFQQPTMLKNLNILDNIILPVLQDDRKKLDQLTKKATALLEKTGIKDLGNRDITEVSGGQLQRAGICRALMGIPDILFADEPTGALNSKTSEEIMNLLVDINQEGTTILIVTHDAKVAAKAQRVLFMKDGQIASDHRFDNQDILSKMDIINQKMMEIEI